MSCALYIFVCYLIHSLRAEQTDTHVTSWVHPVEIIENVDTLSSHWQPVGPEPSERHPVFLDSPACIMWGKAILTFNTLLVPAPGSLGPGRGRVEGSLYILWCMQGHNFYPCNSISSFYISPPPQKSIQREHLTDGIMKMYLLTLKKKALDPNDFCGPRLSCYETLHLCIWPPRVHKGWLLSNSWCWPLGTPWERHSNWLLRSETRKEMSKISDHLLRDLFDSLCLSMRPGQGQTWSRIDPPSLHC